MLRLSHVQWLTGATRRAGASGPERSLSESDFGGLNGLDNQRAKLGHDAGLGRLALGLIGFVAKARRCFDR